MRNRSGAFLALTAVLAGPVGAIPATPDAPEDVSVTVTNLRNAKGKVLACLTANAKAFPDCSKDPAARHVAVPVQAGGAVQLDFPAVVPGTYAISLFHDENGNGKLDTMVMIPKEGFGFSRDARVRFGPPRFSAAAFVLDHGSLHQTVRMRYLL